VRKPKLIGDYQLAKEKKGGQPGRGDAVRERDIVVSTEIPRRSRFQKKGTWGPIGKIKGGRKERRNLSQRLENTEGRISEKKTAGLGGQSIY